MSASEWSGKGWRITVADTEVTAVQTTGTVTRPKHCGRPDSRGPGAERLHWGVELYAHARRSGFLPFPAPEDPTVPGVAASRRVLARGSMDRLNVSGIPVPHIRSS